MATSLPYPRLAGKITLITGASSGFGEATAKLFAECGSHLILTARRLDRLQKLSNEIQSKYPVKIHIAELDVRDNDSVVKMVNGIPEELSGIDILVNNAGLALGTAYAAENSLEAINSMIDTNVKGIFFMVKAILPGMLKRNKGFIINVGSIAGLEGYPGGSVYCATKFAVRGLTEAIRKEVYNTPIRVCNVAPGLAETEFSIVRFSGDTSTAKKPYEGIEALHAEDIADNIAYVASRPDHVQIADLTVMPTNQASVSYTHRQTK